MKLSVLHDGKPMNKIIKKSILTLWLVLFFLMMFVPTSYQPIKAGILSLLLTLICILSWAKSAKITLEYKVFLWITVLVANGLFFILIGVLNSAPGAVRVGTVYVLWPIVFGVIIAAISGLREIEATLRAIAVASAAIGIYMGMYFLYILGILPAALYLELDKGQAVGFHDGFVEFNMYSISTLVFVVPFLFAAIFQWRGPYEPVHRYIIWLAFALCLSMAILSGRRALWLLLIITPFLYLIFAAFQFSRIAGLRGKSKIDFNILFKMGLTLVFLSSFIVLLFDISMEAIFISLIASIPDGSGVEVGADLRFFQAIALIEGWLEKPWFGHGHGAVASIIRSEDMPWAYELTYLALLFHTGLIGTLIYAGCVAWIYWQGVRVIRYSEKYSRLMLPVLVGTTCFLFANATNPYLAKFDFMWIIFVPLAIINCYLKERKNCIVKPQKAFGLS